MPCSPQFVGTDIDTIDFADPALKEFRVPPGANGKKAGRADNSDDEDKGEEADDNPDAPHVSEQIFREYDTKSALVVQRMLWTPLDQRNYEREQAVCGR